jgi:hypothetical protein
MFLYKCDKNECVMACYLEKALKTPRNKGNKTPFQIPCFLASSGSSGGMK